MNDHQIITAERGRRAADLRAAAIAALEQQSIAAGLVLDLDSDQVVAAGPKAAILMLLKQDAAATVAVPEQASQHAAAPVSGREREQFEAWAVSKGWSIQAARAESADDYMDTDTEVAWYGWQARAAVSASQAAPTGGKEQIAAYKPGQWFDARTVDEMQAFYLSRLPAIREAAKEHGYAIGLHGSERRDFDLIAMQWRDGASDRNTLARAIADAACGIRREGSYDWESKPAGRFATCIPVCWTDHENPDFDKPSVGHIDLSIIDRAAVSAAKVPTGELPWLRVEGDRLYISRCNWTHPKATEDEAGPRDEARCRAIDYRDGDMVLHFKGASLDARDLATMLTYRAPAAAPVAAPVEQGQGAGVVPEALNELHRLFRTREWTDREGSWDDALTAVQEEISGRCQVARAATAAHPAAADDQVRDQLDAARYRFLRKGFGDFGPDVDLHNAFVDGNEKMDAAIDKAMREAASRTTAHGGAQGERDHG